MTDLSDEVVAGVHIHVLVEYLRGHNDPMLQLSAGALESLFSDKAKLEERVQEALAILNNSSQPTPERVRDAKLALNRTTDGVKA